jgi:importin subunit beta-1
MSIHELLAAAGSADAQLRGNATAQLDQAREADVSGYLMQLATVLGSAEAPAQSRLMAGILAKNALMPRDVSNRGAIADYYSRVNDATRDAMRTAVARALVSREHFARQAAATLGSAIGQLELLCAARFADKPGFGWPDLLPMLSAAVTEPDTVLQQLAVPDSGVGEQVATTALETLGFLSEDCDADLLEAHANAILTPVVHGLRPDEPNVQVRAAAARALYHAISFAHAAFESAGERDYLMKVVFNACQASDQSVRETAFECLVAVGEEHYAVIGSHMEVIFNVTLAVISNTEEDEDVVKQAIEFWTTVAEGEVRLLEDAEEAAALGIQPSQVSQGYVRQAAGALLPQLLRLLTEQDEDADETDWNPHMAAACCLSHMAQAMGDEIVKFVTPFVTENLGSAEWRNRDAALTALGSILDGPTEDLAPFILSVMPNILASLEDNLLQVKETAAWTISQVCTFFPEVVCSGLNQVMGEMYKCLSDPSPRVAACACYAIYSLASYVEEAPGAPSLEPYFSHLMTGLVTTTSRPDGSKANLRTSAFEALNALVQGVPPSMQGHLTVLVPEFIERLRAAMSMTVTSGEERAMQLEVIGLCCSVLQAVATKLEGAIKPVAETIMEGLLAVLRQSAEGGAGTVAEEGLMAVGSVAMALEADFTPFLAAVVPYIELGLSNVESPTVFKVAVGCVGDVCRAVGEGYGPYTESTFNALLKALEYDEDITIRPLILSLFGDLAFAVGVGFYPYLKLAMAVLRQASMTSVDDSDLEMVEYLTSLHEAILESCTTITHSLQDIVDGKVPPEQVPESLAEYANFMIAFAAFILSSVKGLNTESAAARRKQAVELMGDVASIFGKLEPSVRGMMEAQLKFELQNMRATAEPELLEALQYTLSVI